MILLSDANVLIDLGYVDGLDVLCHLGQVEVLDVVLLECEHHLLTNEKLLREQCQQKDVTVHGTLWVIQESARKQLRSNLQLCYWLKVLPTLDRRLPSREINRLKTELDCSFKTPRTLL